jgi:predicted HAD superfamily Cof-like phosphohydrolase
MNHKHFELVSSFNKEILNIKERNFGLQDIAEFKLSMVQLREEIQEIEEAFDKKDLVGVIDGCIDLEYFLLGILYKMGLDNTDYETIFHIIHSANMQKKKGINAKRTGYDAADAIKLNDWVPPEEAICRYIGLATKEKEKEKSITV